MTVKREMLIKVPISDNDDRLQENGEGDPSGDQALASQIAQIRDLLQTLSHADGDGGDTAHLADPAQTLDLLEDLGETPDESPQETWRKLFVELDDTLAIAKGQLAHEQGEQPARLFAITPGEAAGCPAPGAMAQPGRYEATQSCASDRQTASDQVGDRVTRRSRISAHLAKGRPHRAGGLLCGIVLLTLSLGGLPFLPAILDGIAAATPSSPRPANGDEDRQATASEFVPATTQQAGVIKVSDVQSTARRVELGVARVHRAKPGDVLTLTITTGNLKRDHPGAFIILHEIPVGGTFSRGQSLGLGLWTVTVDDLDDLRMRLPINVPDVSLVTIEAMDSDGVFLAQAATALVIDFSGRQAPTTPLAKLDGRASPGAGPVADAPVLGLVLSARSAPTLGGTWIAWDRVEPRQSLVHVLMATTRNIEDVPRGSATSETSHPTVQTKVPSGVPSQVDGQESGNRQQPDRMVSLQSSPPAKLGANLRSGEKKSSAHSSASDERRHVRESRNEDEEDEESSRSESADKTKHASVSRSESARASRPKVESDSPRKTESKARAPERMRASVSKWDGRSDFLDVSRGM